MRPIRNTSNITQASLSPELDLAFDRFYTSMMAEAEPDRPEFDRAAFAFFETNAEQHGDLDDFFGNFTPLWNTRLNNGNFPAAAAVWDWALRPVIAWEKATSKRLHKGTAFYFAAVTKILAGDLDTGYMLAHRAFEEDRATHSVLSPSTPSLALVAMDPDNRNQAFRAWVVAKSVYVLASVERYKDTHGRTLTFEDLRTKLLKKESFFESTFIFSYSVARLYRLEMSGIGLATSQFAGQLAANILFDVTLVIDAVLCQIEPHKWQFFDLAVALSDRTSLGLSQERLSRIKKLFETDFDGTANGVLDGTVVLPDGFRVQGLAACLALTYVCRNHAAHDLTSISVMRNRFKDVKNAVLDTLFLAVETLP